MASAMTLAPRDPLATDAPPSHPLLRRLEVMGKVSRPQTQGRIVTGDVMARPVARKPIGRYLPADLQFGQSDVFRRRQEIQSQAPQHSFRPLSDIPFERREAS